MTALLSSLAKSISPRKFLESIRRLDPVLADKIQGTLGSGFTIQQILKILDKPENQTRFKDHVAKAQIANPLVEAESIRKTASAEDLATKYGKKAQKIGKEAGLAGMYLASRGLTSLFDMPFDRRDVFARPDAILPTEQKPLGLPGTQAQRGLPAPGPQVPTGPTPPPQTPQAPQGPAGLAQPMPGQPIAPTGQPTPPVEPQTPEIPEVSAVQQKEAEIGQLWDLANKGKTQGNPFLKASSRLIKSGDIKDVNTFANFRKWWQATEGQPRGNTLVEFEKFRMQTKGMFEPPTKSVETGIKPVETFAKGDKVTLPSGKQATVKNVAQKVAQVVREDGREAKYRVTDLKKLSEAAPKAKEFSRALYQQPGESKEEWENRKTIAQAAKKAAKEIVKGKTFLDFPIPEETLKHGGLSVAEDVLNYMAGNSNAYEYLDEDDREEVEKARDLYGAQITPNMVWNMLLVHEPKLKQVEMRPKSVKGRETIKGGKMGSSEFRRSLTHMVYGMLSGHGVSTELADKITKLSSSRALLDTFDEAFKQGKRIKIDSEMEKLMDDDYFNSLFTDEIEEMMKKLR